MSFFVCLKDEKQILFKGDETFDPMAENKSQKKISWCTKILKNSLNFFNKFKINQCKNNLSFMKMTKHSSIHLCLLANFNF